MEKKPYEAPKVYELGTVQDLTENGHIDKCGGSADSAFPTLLSGRFAADCDT